MNDPEFDEESPAGFQSTESNTFHTQSVFAAEVLREFFNLLEEYAPAWYTKQHHDRAVAALRILDEH